MEYRRHCGLRVSEVGVGCYSLTGVYGKKDVDEFVRMVRRAHELGVNLFDTADVYGQAEEVLGPQLPCPCWQTIPAPGR